MYGPTASGIDRFREWIAEPNDRAILRDELRTKLVLADPDDLPRLRAAAEQQARECLGELESLRRPLLAQASDRDVPWSNAAAMLVDDFRLRWLQCLVDWLDAVCAVLDERIEAAAAADR